MHKKLRCYMILGLLFTIAAGTFMHYAYEWSGNSFLIGLIAPVNESTWEHMKLLFFPMLISGIFLTCRLQEAYPNISAGLSVGLLLGTFLIPVLFYTYTGILGFHLLWIDIAVFILSALIAFIVSYYLTITCYFKDCKPFLLLLILILMLCFFFFTVNPPQIGIFQIP